MLAGRCRPDLRVDAPELHRKVRELRPQRFHLHRVVAELERAGLVVKGHAVHDDHAVLDGVDDDALDLGELDVEVLQQRAEVLAANGRVHAAQLLHQAEDELPLQRALVHFQLVVRVDEREEPPACRRGRAAPASPCR